MKIDKLKKMSNGKYKIYLSDGNTITTYDDIILNNNLLFSKEIDNELLNQLEIDNNFYDLYNKCINYISKRIRSEKEIRQYLSKYTNNESDVCDIVNKLKEVGLLNDYMFAKSFISDKLNLSDIGPLKIKNELLLHDIDKDIIEDELSKIDNDFIYNKVNKYIEKHISNNTKYSSYMLKQKILNNLINKGYSSDMILDIFSSYDIKSNIEQEARKQYKKLMNKYCGEELKLKFINKMYQKGYTKEEINEAIKKMD